MFQQLSDLQEEARELDALLVTLAERWRKLKELKNA